MEGVRKTVERGREFRHGSITGKQFTLDTYDMRTEMTVVQRAAGSGQQARGVKQAGQED